jgi:hypothetical protein
VQQVSGKQVPGDGLIDRQVRKPDSHLAREAVKKKGGYTMMLSWKVVFLWGGDKSGIARKLVTLVLLWPQCDRILT